MDRSERMPLRKTLIGRHRNQLVYALIQVSVITADREPYGRDHQGRGQGRRMSQSPSFGDGGIASHQRQVRKTKTEKGEPQIGLCHDLGVASSLRAKRM